MSFTVFRADRLLVGMCTPLCPVILAHISITFYAHGATIGLCVLHCGLQTKSIDHYGKNYLQLFLYRVPVSCEMLVAVFVKCQVKNLLNIIHWTSDTKLSCAK